MDGMHRLCKAGRALCVAVGMTLLLLLSKSIGRVQFLLGIAFWYSFIAHTCTSIVGLLTGYLFAFEHEQEISW